MDQEKVKQLVRESIQTYIAESTSPGSTTLTNINTQDVNSDEVIRNRQKDKEKETENEDS